MMNRRHMLAAGLALPFASGFSSTAHAAILPNNRPMRWVVPFPAGGAADAIARNWAAAYTEHTQQNVVIDNRGGGNGVIGIQALKQAPPDGSTLGVFSVTFFTALPLMLEKAPYDPFKDLTPIAQLVNSTIVCCVTAESYQKKGWKDFPSLIEWAKKPGNELKKGSAGNGSAAHLTIATIAKKSGANIMHVPYKGGAPALNDLLGGQIDMVFDFMPALMPHIASGRLVPLAVGSAERSPIMPDVPGMKEFAALNVGDIDLQSWNALTGPAGMDPALVDKIAKSIHASASPDLAAKLKNAGLVMATTDNAAATLEKLQRDVPKWAEMIQISGAKL